MNAAVSYVEDPARPYVVLVVTDNGDTSVGQFSSPRLAAEYADTASYDPSAWVHTNFRVADHLSAELVFLVDPQ